MSRRPGRCHHPQGQRGVSLVELLVAMVLGLLVVGGVLLAYLGSGISSRQLRALGDMTQDAQIALTLLGRDIQTAGFVEPGQARAPAAGGIVPIKTFRPVFGCDYGFTDPKANFAQAACGPSAAASQPAIEVNYQASKDVNVTNASREPVDCKGEAAQTESLTIGGTPRDVPLVSNRYYVHDPSGDGSASALYCASHTASPAVLVDKVHQLDVRYGVSPNWSSTDASTWRPQRFVFASDVGADWDKVVAVRLCVLIRSAQPVLLAGDYAKYLDCNQALQDSTDRHLYRAFFSTVAIRNKVNR